MWLCNKLDLGFFLYYFSYYVVQYKFLGCYDFTIFVYSHVPVIFEAALFKRDEHVWDGDFRLLDTLF